MAHSESVEAVVLKTYDVGEADRFCIVLTKERGRIAARARGVRKLTSKMGGSLLPLHHVQLVIHNGSSGNTITSVQLLSTSNRQDLGAFYEKQQAIDLLLQLLHDEEPLPDVFSLTRDLCNLHQADEDVFTAFSIQLLHHLGMLPLHTEGKIDKALVDDERAYIENALTAQWHQVPPISASGKNRLQRLCEKIIGEHTQNTLISTKIIREALAA